MARDAITDTVRRLAEAIRRLFADAPRQDHRAGRPSEAGTTFRAARLATIGVTRDPFRL